MTLDSSDTESATPPLHGVPQPPGGAVHPGPRTQTTRSTCPSCGLASDCSRCPFFGAETWCCYCRKPGVISTRRSSVQVETAPSAWVLARGRVRVCVRGEQLRAKLRQTPCEPEGNFSGSLRFRVLSPLGSRLFAHSDLQNQFPAVLYLAGAVRSAKGSREGLCGGRRTQPGRPWSPHGPDGLIHSLDHMF